MSELITRSDGFITDVSIEKKCDRFYNHKQKHYLYLYSNVVKQHYNLQFDLQNIELPEWQKDYLRGTAMEMYTEYLSSSFNGMTFPEAAE